LCVHTEFSYESPGERILKIGPHLPKLLSNIKGYTFWGHNVYHWCSGTVTVYFRITPQVSSI